VEDRFKIVCYYGAWSVYRKAPYNFGVGDIGKQICYNNFLLIFIFLN
jgi:GH18 family chitinase